MPSYIIDLDLPESERWNKLLEEYKNELKLIVPYMKQMIDELLGYSYYPIIAFIKTYRALGKFIMYEKEIQAIADKIGMSFEYTLMMQLCYEATACCTSVVTRVDGNYTFFRTMDWPLSFLKSLTVDLTFQKDGKTLFYVTTWVGYIGALTVTVPEKYSMAVNYRRTQDITFSGIVRNVFNILGMHWPIGHLIRDICEHTTDVAKMKERISTSPLVSPCYITVCYSDDKPEVYARDVADTTMVTNEFVVQTNCDQGKCEPDILYSVLRRQKVTELIERSGNDFITDMDMVHQLLDFPVLNDETVYYSVMSPKFGVHYSKIIDV